MVIDVRDPPDVDMIAFSDLHLGRSDLAMALDWAETWIPRVRQKILALGDIMDLQVAGTVRAFREASAFLWLLLAIKQRLCRVIYLSGNHDSRLSEILESTGDVTILGGHEVHRFGPQLYCTHGHRYDWADRYLYEPLDKVNFLGSPILAAAMRAIDRRTGRINNTGLRKRVIADVRKLRAGSVFLHGHTHEPHDYGTDGNGRRAIDLGSGMSPETEIQFAAKIYGVWEMLIWHKR